MVVGFAMAAPAPAKSTKKAYYTSPVREFRGAAFYQWKKNETVKVAKVTSDEANKETAVKTESKPVAQPTASIRTN